MPLFKLDTPTEAKLTALTPRTEHHGEDLVAAMSLALTITGPNTMLDLLSPTLRKALYQRADDETQDALDGIEPPTPKLRTKHLGPLTLVIPEISGGTLFVEWGISEDMCFSDCKVGKWRLECMEGGTVALSFRVSTSDVSEEEAGHLFGKQGQMLAIRFEPPAPLPAESTGPVIDGTKGPGPLFDERGPTDAFIAAHGVDPDDDAADDPDDGIGGEEAQAQPTPRGRKAPVAKYRDPETGQTWTGRGLKPLWLVRAIEGGKSLSDFVAEGATA